MKEAEIAQELTSKVGRLERQISRLKKLNQIFLEELAERGKELEKLNFLFCSWRSQIPESLTEKMAEIFDGYIRRCTIEKTAKQMRQTA